MLKCQSNLDKLKAKTFSVLLGNFSYLLSVQRYIQIKSLKFFTYCDCKKILVSSFNVHFKF